MKTYYIYHIPDFVHKDGSIGKIGCTMNPNKRPLDQGYSEWEILEEHSDVYIVSNREIELQKQYDYPVDTVPYWKSLESMLKNRKAGTFNREAIIKGAKRAKEVCSKIVYQFDLNGNFIKEYPSYSEATKQTGIGHIHHVCLGKRKTAGGYKWKYKH